MNYHELRAVWRRSKLKNKVGTLVTRDISRYLKGPTKKWRYVTVLFTKTTRIHSERILAVSPEILHTEQHNTHNTWAKNKRKLFPDGKSRGPFLARAALNSY